MVFSNTTFFLWFMLSCFQNSSFGMAGRLGGLPEHADLDFPSVFSTMRVLEIHHCNLDHMIIVKKWIKTAVQYHAKRSFLFSSTNTFLGEFCFVRHASWKSTMPAAIRMLYWVVHLPWGQIVEAVMPPGRGPGHSVGSVRFFPSWRNIHFL